MVDIDWGNDVPECPDLRQRNWPNARAQALSAVAGRRHHLLVVEDDSAIDAAAHRRNQQSCHAKIES